MKRLVLAIGLLAVGFAASTAARADFAVIKYRDGSCRVWTDTKASPMGKDWKWVGKPVKTQAAAAHKGAWAVKHHVCKSWS